MSSSSSLEKEIDEYQTILLGVRVVVKVVRVACPAMTPPTNIICPG